MNGPFGSAGENRCRRVRQPATRLGDRLPGPRIKKKEKKKKRKKKKSINRSTAVPYFGYPIEKCLFVRQSLVRLGLQPAGEWWHG